MILSCELGYEDVSYFETKEEVLTEIIRLGKTLRPLKYKVADTVFEGRFVPKDIHVVVDLNYVNGNLGVYTYKVRAEFKGFVEHWMLEKDLRPAGGRRLDLVREWRRAVKSVKVYKHLNSLMSVQNLLKKKRKTKSAPILLHLLVKVQVWQMVLIWFWLQWFKRFGSLTVCRS